MKESCLTWKIVDHNVQFSDNTILCEWLRLGKDLTHMCLEGKTEYEQFQDAPLEKKHFVAKFSEPLERMFINVGMRDKDPFVIFDQKITKPFTFLEFILQVRSSMTFTLSDKEHALYYQHTSKYFEPEAPKGDCYYQMWHSEEPFLYPIYDATSHSLEVDWTR